MNCYLSYLTKDRIKRKKFNVNPKILPNEVYICLQMTKILAQVVFQSISKHYFVSDLSLYHIMM